MLTSLYFCLGLHRTIIGGGHVDSSPGSDAARRNGSIYRRLVGRDHRRRVIIDGCNPDLPSALRIDQRLRAVFKG